MNKQQIIESLKSYIVSRNDLTDLSSEIDNITTNLQHALKKSLVFYKLQNNPVSIDVFYKRLENVDPGLIILNHGAEFIKRENCIFVDEIDYLKLQKIICDIIYPNLNKMKLVGVTGTNGKTTTVNLAMAISSQLGHPAISVGTIGIFDINGPLNQELESTTPSYVEVRKIIHQYQNKYDAAFIEISSHALIQSRPFDLMLDQAAWTSFSQDHLDFHKTMEEYFTAKLLIERKYLKEPAKLLLPPEEKALILKIESQSPNTRFSVVKTLKELKITNYPLFYSSPYNQSNAELALALNAELWNINVEGFDLNKIATPKGRFSVIEIGESAMAIIDYAHTPDALLNIGRAIKSAFPKHKIVVCFGCGGNRDKSKRPLMGKAVASFANRIMVTSDNPRDENPEDIIVNIISGIDKEYDAMTDRKKAILTCLDELDEGEILLIAGKGHEEYQEIKGEKHPFSDFDIVLEYKKNYEEQED